MVDSDPIQATIPTAMPSITFIATSRRPDRYLEDPSFRYRCENPALALHAAGWQTQLTHLSRLQARQAGQVAVFHRPVLSPWLAWQLWRLRRRGVLLVADFDDLVFDPDCAGHSPAVLNGILPLDTVRRAFAASHRALARFDRVTVSTGPLRDHVQRLAPGLPVSVLPNAVHHSWLAQPLPAARDEGQRIISYFPGTRSHDRDFSLIVPALERLLAQHPELAVHITGRLRCSLAAAPGQLVLNERVAFADYAAHVRRGWVNLAPLEDTPFNRCKSALKVIEAGFHGIPTVCSPTADAARFRAAGALPVAAPEDWGAAIERLLQPEAYRDATRELRERILALAHPALLAQLWLQAID